MTVLDVAKLDRPHAIDADWDKHPWCDVPAVLIGNYMGDKPSHFPRTQVKIARDDLSLYVIFRVEDRYVRAVASDRQGDVYKDSCVEFFFAPDAESPRDYFNLEVNCGGTMLFHFQRAGEDEHVEVSQDDCDRIEIAASLPRIVAPENAEPLTWTVEYRLPLEVLGNYCSITPPADGVAWRANFYKCADETSHAHWLTWSPVVNPKPNFHLPEFFGILRF